MAQLVTDPLNYIVDLLGKGGKKELISSNCTVIVVIILYECGV